MALQVIMKSPLYEVGISGCWNSVGVGQVPLRAQHCLLCIPLACGQPTICLLRLQALPDEGQAYWLGLDLTCLEGEFENQADVLGVGIIVQDLGGDLKNETSIQTIIELKPVSVEDV